MSKVSGWGSAAVLVLAGALTFCGTDERFAMSELDAGKDAATLPDAPPEASTDADAGPLEPELPIVPVGLDAYRFWDRLYQHRIGVRTSMRSTYDRAGNNEAADASHFLRQEADDFNVTLDVAGPGVLYFVRTNHWHGSPWHYVVDGKDHGVSESSTADPTKPVPGSVFLPEAAFPPLLTWTWSTTKGADLNWVPITFQNSFTLAYGRTHYGTGYYVYQQVPKDAEHLSQPITTWNEEPPAADVLALIGQAGSDIAPVDTGTTTTETTVDVAAQEKVLLADLSAAPAVVRALRLRISRDQALALGRARLIVTWDDRSAPSVDAPVALFFGTGTLYNRNDAEWLVKGLLSNVRFDATDVVLSSYFPMPFFSKAKLELVSEVPLTKLGFHLRTRPFEGEPRHAGYFHATYRDHPKPVPGKDLVILETAKTEEGGDFCGSFVGMSWIFSDAAELGTLEGDPRFFFDDSESAQAYGTGTEEWGGGGDYWGGQNMTLPFAGHPVGAPSPGLAKNSEDRIESAYRFLLADAMPFGKNARIQLEHGGINTSTEHYQSVAYWYGAPGGCLRLTDELDVGDPSSEAAHAYSSPEGGAPETVSSRYEWGPDHVDGVEVFPETSDSGRSTRGTSEFRVKLAPENRGILLRRKLDYSVPNQRAEVYLADDAEGAPFVHVGSWYLAGSNRCVYSNPPGELGATEHHEQVSNRRWREDELSIAEKHTRGKAAVRVRIVHVPVDLPLHPGSAVLPSAWSEFRYRVYSWVLPPAPR